jgi:hypothetical protein
MLDKEAGKQLLPFSGAPAPVFVANSFHRHGGLAAGLGTPISPTK